MRRIAVLCAALFLFGAAALDARATTAIKLTPEEQVADADAIVRGRCAKIESRIVEEQVLTYVSFDVSDVIKGHATRSRLVVRQLGGRVGDFAQWIEGSPRFDLGGEYVLFLANNGEGAYVVSGLFMGNFTVEADGAGREWIVRDDGEGSLVLPRSDVPASRLGDRMALADVRRIVDIEARTSAKRDDSASVHQIPVEYTGPFTGQAEFPQHFVLMDNGRWFEGDTDQTVNFACGPANFMEGAGNAPDLPSAVRDALASWSSVSESNLRMNYTGIDESGCGWRRDGISRVTVDCSNQVAGQGCSSIIAIGGANNYDYAQTITIHGTQFKRIREADVCLNDGFCDLFNNPTYLRYIITHELGHCLGLAHSTVREATMYSAFLYSNAARGAALSTDDQAAIRFVYPGASTGGGGGGGGTQTDPPVIVTDVLSAATFNTAYTVSFAVDKGEGPFTWAVTDGALPAGLALSTDGVLSGVPTATGTFSFGVTVTDVLARNATKALSMRVAVPPPVVLAAEYRAGRKTLTIVAQNLAVGATLAINGVVIGPPRPVSIDPASGQIVVHGGRKKLNLHGGVGSNEAVVTVDGVSSAPYFF